MNRLATRLLLAVLAVALLSLAVVPLAQSIALRRTIDRLTPDFRARVLERTEPTPFGRPRSRGERPPLPDDDGSRFLSEENSRLFGLLSDYRTTQRRTVVLGSAGALLLAVGLAAWLTRSVARPIEAVSQAASRLADGDLSTRVDLARFASPPDETRELAHDFNAMAEALETLEGERKAMIADIAHELRNPLATMLLRLDALEDGLVPFGPNEVGLLKGQVGLLSRLIDDLRTLSLADAGRLSLRRVELDPARLLTELGASYLDRARQRDVALRVLPPATSVTVHADPDRLSQIVRNLLDNALAATPPRGWVELSLAVDEAEIVLRVRDSGPGIPEEQLGTIFERFTRGERRDTQGGSGLGLAIVNTLVALHGGRVRASNHPEGALFEVTLPRSPTSD